MISNASLSRGATEMLDAYLLGQPVTIDQLSWWFERLLNVACAPLSDKVTMTRDDVLPDALAALRSVDRLWYALVG